MKVFVHSNFFEHPKLLRLAGMVGVPDVLKVGAHLIKLWGWTMEFHENGIIGAVSAVEVAEASRWTATPADVWLEHLLAHDGRFSGWLDKGEHGLEVHDWLEHQGALIAKRASDRAYMVEKRRRDRDSTLPALKEAIESVAPEGSVQHLMAVAKQAKLIGHPASIRNHVEGWHARWGAAATEKLILDNAGRDVKEIQIEQSRKLQANGDESGAAHLRARAEAMRKEKRT